MNFYNDNDAKVCAWLRVLIKSGLIPNGIVDERPIQEINPDELEQYPQCHFFAGIGGWAYALQLAGWPAGRPVWTASLPCQSFSSAGKQKGFGDDRGNLWFPFLGFVRKHRPVTIFGEQVKAAIGHGWLDRIFTDLEQEGYTCGATVLGAHSVGSPHIRQRVYWVANAGHQQEGRRSISRQEEIGRTLSNASRCSDTGIVANPNMPVCNERTRIGEQQIYGKDEIPGIVGNADIEGLQISKANGEQTNEVAATITPSNASGLGNAQCAAQERLGQHSREILFEQETKGPGRSSAWSNCEWLPCTDGKSRRVESGSFPLAHGVPARVVRLRGYGNSIVPQVGAAFIKAFLESRVEQ